MEKAIQHEITRQIDVVEAGDRVVQETRLWDADREVTRSMRSKEFAHDYRYFPDPDLLPLVIDTAWIQAVQADLPELPAERRARLIQEYGLPAYDAGVLTARRDVADYYEAAVRAYPDDPKTISNWLIESVLRSVKEEKLDTTLRTERWPSPPEHLGQLVGLIKSGTISSKIAKTVYEEMRHTGEAPEAIVQAQGLTQVSDTRALETHVDAVMAANPDKVETYRGGKEKLIGFFVGQVMRATPGKANPQMVNDLLQKKLTG